MFLVLRSIIFALCITSCFIGTENKSLYWLKPGGKIMMQMPKGGSTAYNQGWRDGCESGLSIFNHTFHKHFYRFRKDQRFYGMRFGDKRDLFNGKKITEKDQKEYQTGWYSTYIWCRHYILGIQQGGQGMTPNLPGDDTVYNLHGTHHIYELQSWGNNTTNGWFANW